MKKKKGISKECISLKWCEQSVIITIILIANYQSDS